MYLVKTPAFIRSLFPNFVWNMNGSGKKIYLTFDDGPIAEVTPWVVEQLAIYNAKATFFCVGDNIIKHPDVFQQLLESGHQIGSHTFNHLNGWMTDNLPYFHNVRHAANLVPTNLFRPPYGKLKPSQANFLLRHYDIVMWDILSGDFDSNISKQQCLDHVLDYAQDGSIIVFHDSLKTIDKLETVLPIVLKHFADQGYQFDIVQKQRVSAEVQVLATA